MSGLDDKWREILSKTRVCQETLMLEGQIVFPQMRRWERSSENIGWSKSDLDTEDNFRGFSAQEEEDNMRLINVQNKYFS